MFLLLASFLAGLGLFFHGLGGVKSSVQGIASRRVRGWLARWSQYPLLAGVWGIVFGGITQSVTAVAFIVASLVSGGLLTVRRALPVVACANLGTAALVLAASFDVHIAVLGVLGAMGLMVAFDLVPRVRALWAGLFFVAVLFLGLRMMRDVFGPLAGMPWFGAVAAFTQGSLVAAFVLGAVLRLFVQSSPAIAVIAITLSRGGLLSAEQVMAMMFGTGLGVGGAVWLLSSNLRGVPRQIALYQALLGVTASLTMGVVFAVERFTGWPLIAHRLQEMPGNESLRLAYAFVGMQVLAVGYGLVTMRWMPAWLERLSPPTAEEDLARPRFIHAQALADVESGLGLVEKEQFRLLARLAQLLDTVREETAAAAVVPAAVLQRATVEVNGALKEFLRGVAEIRGDAVTAGRLLQLEHRQGIVAALGETTWDFVVVHAKLRGEPAIAAFLGAQLEGLHAVVLTTIEAVEQPESADRDLVLALTADRGDVMERSRRGILAAAPALEPEAKVQLAYLTSLFEREVWLLRQLAQTMEPATGGAV